MRHSPLTAAALAATLVSGAGVSSQVQFQARNLNVGPAGNESQQLRVADFDGDGFYDISLCGIGNVRTFLNDKSGGYTASANVSLLGIFDHRVGDLDGDGDTDIVLTNAASPTRGIELLINDGRGNFTLAPATQMPNVSGALYTRLADLDRDGDLDIITGKSGQSSVLFENRAGTFVDVSSRILRNTPASITHQVHDVDLDGRPDLVTHTGTAIVILFQDSAGNFGATSRSIPIAEPLMTIALADVDKDGDTEIFAGAGFGKDQYFEANGLSWTEVSARRLPPVARGLSLRDARFVDIDEDGDLDLIVPKTSANPTLQDRTRVYANDGAGNFSDITMSVLAPPAGVLGDVTIEDVDGDGDTDILYYSLRNNAISVVLEENSMRRCSAPEFAKIGTQLDIDLFAREGFAPPGQVSIPLIATRAATRAIPVSNFGSLGLDLGTLLVLPSAPHGITTGKASVGIPVPNSIALAGLQVWSQALTLQNAQLRFSNVQHTTIFR